MEGKVIIELQNEYRKKVEELIEKYANEIADEFVKTIKKMQEGE
jgi:hypothetical protein